MPSVSDVSSALICVSMITWIVIGLAETILYSANKLIPLNYADKRTVGEPTSMLHPRYPVRFPVPQSSITVEANNFILKS